MFDANRILGQLMGSPATAGFAGGLAGGMLTSKGGRKMAKKGLKYGGIAAVGALAYSAWQQHQQRQAQQQPAAPDPHQAPGSGPAAGMATGSAAGHAAGVAPGHQTPPPASAHQLPPPPAGSAFLPPAQDAAATNALGLTLVRAMIAAANADGRLDGDEMQNILGRIDTLELSAEDKGQLMDELRQPVEMDQLVAAATSPEVATEIYVAARLAIEVDTAGERFWLKELASQLQLPPDVVQTIDQQVAQAAG